MLPDKSLAPQVLDWCSRYIRQPDGPDAGGPWRFTPEQRRFLWYLYAIDENGRWLWTRAVLRRAKGWGKSPVMAALALAELCGPVRFGGWKGDEPIGVPVTLPWVQIAGISERQTTNTMSMVLAMLHESPIIDEYGLDPGLTRIYTATGGKLEPTTASASTAEGARPSFCVLDETHLWKQADGGHKLAEVIRRNLGKSRDGAARSVETTNAHEMGMDSVAERSYDAWQAQLTGKSVGSTILYDSREAPADTELQGESLRRGLVLTYGDSNWVDFSRIEDEIYDPATPPSESRQFYLNQLSVAEDAWLAPREWDKRADRTKIVLEGEEIAVGFDGGETDDNTALVGCRISDSHLFTIGLWDPAKYGALGLPRTEIDGAVRKAFSTFEVVGFYGDRHPWESYIDRWGQDLGRDLSVSASLRNPVEFDMRGRLRDFTLAAENFHAATLDGELTHDGSAMAVQQVYNARRRPNQYSVIGGPGSFGKEHRESPKKVDWLAAAVLARKARQDYLALPDNKKRHKRTGRAMFV